PTAERTTVVERVATLKIVGRVPHARAHLFRPGVAVDVYGIMGLSATAAKPHPMMCVSIEHVLATDIDGADVVLIDPVDPPPRPPAQTDPNGANPAGAPGVTGGGASGNVEEFVRICLSQTGKRYVFGAEAAKTNADPAQFDCSELIEWAAARAGIPGVPDGSAAQINACNPVSVEQAINTRGALLYHPGHIAVSLGNSRTIEASSSSRPVGELNARGRGFTRGGLLRNATGYAAHPDTGNILPS
ncbi:MAG: C40 family peptidase, partial [Pseudonocardiaceae bacterium]